MDQISNRVAVAALRFLATLGEFRRNRRGNVAVMFALAMMPIMAAAGIGVDLSRAYVVKAHLTHALDAAGLAVAGSPGASDEYLETLAQDFFNANYPDTEIGVPGALQLTVGDNVVTLSASATLPTALLGIFGIDEMDVASEIEVTRENKGLEVVLVLDNTGSMSWNGKIGSLRKAAKDLIDILFQDDPFPEKLRMGIVPFAAAVNVGTEFDQAYLDMDGLSSIHGENFSPGTNIWDLYEEINNRDWVGCVETRPMPHDTLDSPPSIATPDTLWVPWFAPDEPEMSGYPNRYLKDEISGSAEERQRFTGKYIDSKASPSSRGPQNGCGMKPIMPLSNDRDALRSEIDGMIASGLTHIPVGLAWGWRVISPGEPFTEGAAYDDEEVTKAMILLTDGENVVGTRNNHNKSYYTAYGYLAEGRMGTTNGSTAADRLDEKTLEICENIKEEGIRLYTITFQVNGNQTQDLMEECATSPALYFDSPSNEQLQTVFQAIARDLSNLRLSK